MSTYEEGDVLHYTNRDSSYATDEVWVLVTKKSDGQGASTAILLKGSFAQGSRVSTPVRIMPSGSESAEGLRRVVPPDELPDDIARAAALYELTGDAS